MKWISVKKELPKNHNILVEFKGPDQGQGYAPREPGYYYGAHWISRVDAIVFDKEEITHWRGPLKLGFFICPVRKGDKNRYSEKIRELERGEWDIHWPPRDTNQNDLTGLGICKDNLRMIKDADIIFFAWDGKSQGCLFDLGMAFALDKRIKVIEMPPLVLGKSFQNMVQLWGEQDK